MKGSVFVDVKKEQQEALQSVFEYIPKLIAGLKGIAEKYHIGDEESANKEMVEAVEGLNWLFEALSLTAEVQIEKVSVAEMKEQLEELVDAFENNDYIALCDVIEYEIVETLEKWFVKVARNFSEYKH